MNYNICLLHHSETSLVLILEKKNHPKKVSPMWMPTWWSHDTYWLAHLVKGVNGARKGGPYTGTESHSWAWVTRGHGPSLSIYGPRAGHLPGQLYQWEEDGLTLLVYIIIKDIYNIYIIIQDIQLYIQLCIFHTTYAIIHNIECILYTIWCVNEYIVFYKIMIQNVTFFFQWNINCFYI